MAGVGGQALGGVDRRGVPEFDAGGDVAGGQCHVVTVSCVLDADSPVVVKGCDPPPVTVLHPVGGGGAQGSVVGASDDGVSDRAHVAVGEGDAGVVGGVVCGQSVDARKCNGLIGTNNSMLAAIWGESIAKKWCGEWQPILRASIRFRTGPPVAFRTVDFALGFSHKKKQPKVKEENQEGEEGF